jgi:hypothetical protein
VPVRRPARKLLCNREQVDLVQLLKGLFSNPMLFPVMDAAKAQRPSV